MSTAAMNSYNSEQTSRQWHLGRKLVLIALLVTAIALGLVILFRQKTNIPLQFFNILADTTLGLIAGVSSRIILRERNWFIRAITSTAMVIVGLSVLGYFTQGKSGFDATGLARQAVSWQKLVNATRALNWNNMLGAVHLGSAQIGWLGLAHIVIAIDTSWVAMRAWKGSPQYSVGQSSQVVPRGSNHSSARAARPSVPSVAIHVPVASTRAQVRRKRSSGREMVAKATARARASARPARSRQWNPLRHKPEVQLAVYEEHRCPYCLEPVKRNDPRGSVECEVCHTLHHKDCWDITGICQVPHLNT